MVNDVLTYNLSSVSYAYDLEGETMAAGFNNEHVQYLVEAAKAVVTYVKDWGVRDEGNTPGSFGTRIDVLEDALANFEAHDG